MGMTVKHNVWYPDLTDIDQPNVWGATLAQSVADGIGDRLGVQEEAIGLKCSLADHVINYSSTKQTVPFTINAGTGDFNNGFTFSGGIATVQTKGMYLVTASVGGSTGSGTGMRVEIYQNSVNFATAETPQQASIWVSAAATCVLNCVPGDTIYVKGQRSAGSAQFNEQSSANYISIAMVQAVP